MSPRASSGQITRVLTLCGLAALVVAPALAAPPDVIHTHREAGALVRFGGEGLDRPEAAAVDETGRVYVVGGASSAWSGGRVTRHDVDDRPFVMAFDPGGRVAWQRILGPTGFVFVTAWDDARGQLVSAGTTASRRDGQVDVFVVAHDRDGRERWRTVFDRRDSRSSGLEVRGIALGPDGEVYLTGQTRGDLAGTRHIGTPYNGAHNGWDVFVLGLSPRGDLRFSRIYGVGDPDPDRVPTQYNDYASGIAVADGRVHVVGGTSGNLLTHRKARAWRRFHLTLSLDGRSPKVRYRPESAPIAYQMVAAPGGGLYVVSISSAPTHPGAKPATGVKLGAADLILERLDSKGNRRWATRFGSHRRDLARGLTVDRAGQVWVSSTAGLHDRPDALLFRFDPRGALTGQWALASPQTDEPAAVVAGPDRIAWVGTVGGALGDAPSMDASHVYVPADGFVRWLAPNAASESDAQRRVTRPVFGQQAVNPLGGG